MPSTLPPPALPVEVLVEFMRGRFGIAGKWTPLEGERDQNYQVTEAGGEAWVFKVCNPDEGDAIATCQAAALEHIAHVDPALPVPRVRHTLAGERLAVLSHDGQDYRVMVLSYLSGEVIGETGLQRRQLHEMGQLLARLGISLRGFIDPAPASRDLVWDTWKASNLSVQVPKLPPGDQLLAAEILVHHRDVTVPALAGMRCQTIHGDVHPFNSLVDETGAISGIIDFGDLVQGALVLDLSNALADFLTPGKDNAAIIFELVRGYAAMTRLEEIEADAILDLVEVRLLMTPLIDS